MDLVFDIELTASAPKDASSLAVTTGPDEAVTLAHWYDWGYDAVDVNPATTSLSVTTTELVAYWWGKQDAVNGLPRRDIS